MSNKATLVALFQQGDVPSGSNFADLINSQVNINETAVQSMQGALNPTEIITPRVSATNVNVTGTLAIAGQTSAGNINCADVSANVVWASGARFSTLTINASGTTQATAALLTATINIGANITDGSQTGFILNANQTGRVQYIYNGNASANLWPCTGGQINALASNAAFGMVANTMYTILHVRASGYAVK